MSKWIDKKSTLHLGKGKFLKYGDDVPDSLSKELVKQLKKDKKVGDILAPVSVDVKKELEEAKTENAKLKKELEKVKK